MAGTNTRKRLRPCVENPPKRQRTGRGSGLTPEKELLLDCKPLDFFCYYVKQACLKHSPQPERAHRFVQSHAFPPAGISTEIVVRFVQKYIQRRVAKGDPILELILVGTYQAPDHPFCYREILPTLLRGVQFHRQDRYRRLLSTQADDKSARSKPFEELQKQLEDRYVRGIDPELIRSGVRKGNVYGYGEVGIYSAEHQTSVMPGLTHPEGLRWKLEHWPLWLEKVIYPLLCSWPASTDSEAIRTMLETRFSKELPEGINTKLPVGPGRSRKIVDLFGGDVDYALSAVSQAFLFSEMLRPSLREHRTLRQHGLGAGCFTVRGFWMAYHRNNKTFPCLDTATFCPGFVGALKGAAAVKVAQFTGVNLSGKGADASISWNSWKTQLRFGCWLTALQRHTNEAAKEDPSFRQAVKAAGLMLPLHCSDVEADLCFMSRLVTMFREPEGSAMWQSASRGIGSNLPQKLVSELFK
mmetsp:Transcript_34192/g.72803  ORF Transcript_34192/g.72803 Transcript_34192/m.72803 type:complete len:469 (+) Transcript_34192:94-1500(+)